MIFCWAQSFCCDSVFDFHVSEVLLLEQQGLSMVETLPSARPLSQPESTGPTLIASSTTAERAETYPASSRCLGPELEMIVTSNSLQGN